MSKTQSSKSVLTILYEVYKSKTSIAETILIAFFFAFLISLIQNIGQIMQIFTYQISVIKKISLAFSILLNLYTNNLSLPNLFVYLLLILLLAVNITVTIFYFKKRGEVKGSSSTIVSTIIGIFGTGCLACGGIVISTLASALGVVSGLSILATIGSWFIYLAIVILLYSIYKTLLKIGAPLVC